MNHSPQTSKPAAGGSGSSADPASSGSVAGLIHYTGVISGTARRDSTLQRPRYEETLTRVQTEPLYRIFMITRKYLFALLTVLMICLTFFCFNETDTQERYPVSWDSSYFTIGVGQTPVKTKQNWQQWLAQPFWPDDSESIKVSNRAGQKAAVSTCNQLFAADSKEMESVGANFHIYRAWAKKCYAGRAISRAADAKQSFVHDFVFNKTNIKQLPADLSMPISPDDEKEVKKVDARGGNHGHFLNGTTFTFKNTAETKSAHIAYPGYYTQNFTLIARGDFNHDGGEDLLVGTNLDANQAGTYSAYGLYIVSRSGPNAPYKLIRQLPIYGHDTSF